MRVRPLLAFRSSASLLLISRIRERWELKTRYQTKLIREGEYAAEVEVDLIENEGDWGPFLSLDDAEKLDRVREALRRGDVDQASRLGKVFRLLPISA